MKILMSSWRSRIRTQKKVDKITSVVAPIFSSCPSAGDSFAPALDLQEHLQTTPDHDHDQRLRGSATRPTQPIDDEQQPARALTQDASQYCSAPDDHIKLCPQDLCSSDLLHYRKPVEVRHSSEESLYMKTDTSITKELYEMDMLSYQYTLRNALLSIGTLGGELLGHLQCADDQMGNNEKSSFLDYIVAAEDENAEYQHFPKLINDEDTDAHEKKLVNGYHDMKSNNTLAALCINNGMQYVLQDSTLDGFLKGLCMFGEVAQQEDFGDNRASKCTHRGADQRMVGPSCYYESVDKILDLSENAHRSTMGSCCTRSSREETVSSSGNAQGRLGSPGLHAQGMIRSSYSSYEDCMLGSIKGASRAQEILDLSKNTHEEMMGSPTSIVGSFSSPSSCAAVVNYTLPKGSRFEDNVKEEDKYIPSAGSAHKSNCLKLASTCNHHMDLKRLILSLTPNCVAKRLLKRFKLVHRPGQTDQASAPLMNCNYQCKLSKQFMRMLGVNQNRIPSNVIVKRELRPLAGDYDDMLPRRQAEENWIRTDLEYVVLELEGNIQ